MKKIIAAALLVLSIVPAGVLADSFQSGGVGSNISTGTSTTPINGVVGDCQSIAVKSNNQSPTVLQNLDCSGNLGQLLTVAAHQLRATNLTSGDCIQADSSGNLVSASAACGGGGGGGGVASITIPFPYNAQTGRPFQAAVSNYWANTFSSNPQSVVDAFDGFPTHTITGLSITCLPYNATLATNQPGLYPYSTTSLMTGGTMTLVQIDGSDSTAYTTVGTVTLPNCSSLTSCTTTAVSSFAPYTALPNTEYALYSSAVGSGGEDYRDCNFALIGK